MSFEYHDCITTGRESDPRHEWQCDECGWYTVTRKFEPPKECKHCKEPK